MHFMLKCIAYISISLYSYEYIICYISNLKNKYIFLKAGCISLIFILNVINIIYSKLSLQNILKLVKNIVRRTVILLNILLLMHCIFIKLFIFNKKNRNAKWEINSKNIKIILWIVIKMKWRLFSSRDVDLMCWEINEIMDRWNNIVVRHITKVVYFE